VRSDQAVGGFTRAGFASFGQVDNIVATWPGREPTLLAVRF
jgi:hypothetical protein